MALWANWPFVALHVATFSWAIWPIRPLGLGPWPKYNSYGNLCNIGLRPLLYGLAAISLRLGVTMAVTLAIGAITVAIGKTTVT